MNKKSIVFRCLVALLCLVCTIVVTYSWFNRSNRVYNDNGDRMQYSEKIQVNGNGANLDMSTQFGMDDGFGHISYSRLQNNSLSNVEPGEKIYFKTTVTNKGDFTKVTLLLTAAYSVALDNYIQLGTISYMNTLKKLVREAGASIVRTPIIRNVDIPAGTVSSPTSVDIVWYIYIDKSYSSTVGAITINEIKLFAN